MYCEEFIEEVYECMPDYDDNGVDWFLDCYHGLSLYLTKGYRLVLKTESYFICIAADGVKTVPNTEKIAASNEYMDACIHEVEGYVPWVDAESTLFTGERLAEVREFPSYYEAVFDDFVLKVIPCEREEDVPCLDSTTCHSYHYVHGFERLLTKKCECGGEGEILMDFVSDYLVGCKVCKKSTRAGMNVVDAIEDWNAREIHCDLSDIIIE